MPCWLDNVWILPREVTLQSLVEFKGLIVYSGNSEYNWIVDVPLVGKPLAWKGWSKGLKIVPWKWILVMRIILCDWRVMMIRLPQYSKLRSQPQQAFLWVNLDEEEERTGLYIPNSTTTKSAAHRSSRLALSKLLMKGFTMSDKISASGNTCYGALNPTFTAQPFHVHKFPRCKFEVECGSFLTAVCVRIWTNLDSLHSKT